MERQRSKPGVQTFAYQAQLLLAMERPGLCDAQQQAIMNYLERNLPVKAAYRRLRDNVKLPYVMPVHTDPLYTKKWQWQQSISDEERRHLVDLIDSRIHEPHPSGPYAVELGVYLTSSSRDEYYRQLAESIRQIEEEQRAKTPFELE